MVWFGAFGDAAFSYIYEAESVGSQRQLRMNYARPVQRK